jgi:hypothetical protein
MTGMCAVAAMRTMAVMTVRATVFGVGVPGVRAVIGAVASPVVPGIGVVSAFGSDACCSLGHRCSSPGRTSAS